MATKSDKSSLNRKQIKAAEMLANPDFSGTITELCSVVGVARSTFYDWMSQKEFRKYTDELIDLYTDGELSRVWKALMRRIDVGDIQAIKLYFELKGKYKPDIREMDENLKEETLSSVLSKQSEEVWRNDPKQI